MKPLSICMTHFNRKKQLLNTLQSIQNQENAKDLTEIIIVDDVSLVPLKLKDFNDFDLDIKLISIQTNNKWWINPCVAFNCAINFIHSDIVILQNAECLHATDIIKYTIKNLQQNEYVAMSALNLSEGASKEIDRKNLDDIDTTGAYWYCHSKYLPKPFHFCAAMHNSDLRSVGGFDPRFSEGMFYDDDALLVSLAKKGVKIRIEDSQLVYHQWHENVWGKSDNRIELKKRNLQLFESIK